MILSMTCRKHPALIRDLPLSCKPHGLPIVCYMVREDTSNPFPFAVDGGRNRKDAFFTEVDANRKDRSTTGKGQSGDT